MANNDQMSEKEQNRAYVPKREAAHFQVTLNDVATASSSANGMIESITAEFSKRIRLTAKQVSDSDDTTNLQ